MILSKHRVIEASRNGNSVLVEKMWMPFFLQKLIENTGIKEGNWITFVKMMKIFNVETYNKKNNLKNRLIVLVRLGLLKKRVMSLGEKRRMYGLQAIRRPNLYTLSEKGKAILEEYQSFTNLENPLIKNYRW